MIIILSFDKNESYAESNCVLVLLFGSAVPDSARDVPMTRRLTSITATPPYYVKLGAPVALS